MKRARTAAKTFAPAFLLPSLVFPALVGVDWPPVLLVELEGGCEVLLTTGVLVGRGKLELVLGTAGLGVLVLLTGVVGRGELTLEVSSGSDVSVSVGSGVSVSSVVSGVSGVSVGSDGSAGVVVTVGGTEAGVDSTWRANTS